jgi:hypothetical protein
MEHLEQDGGFNEDHLKLINEVFFPEQQMLAEGLIGDVKQKAKSWLEKAKSAAGDMLPTLVGRYEQALHAVKKKLGDAASAALEKEMSKQVGADWKSDAIKVAAALAVASTMMTATSAQAGDYRHPNDHRVQQGPLTRGDVSRGFQSRPDYHRHSEPRYVGGPVIIQRYVAQPTYSYPAPAYAAPSYRYPEPNYAGPGIQQGPLRPGQVQAQQQGADDIEDVDQAELEDMVRAAVQEVLKQRALRR